ncbi:MAG: protein kinase [Deltaproteobacteria bacterium]|nr:protein kinase [Deltaproteobacteria bacterium]
MMETLVGRGLGEFVVRELLSSGGFGQVYRAEQPKLGREAVIKVLHARHRASEVVAQRFLREAQLASRLDHPFAAHVYAFGAEPDGVLWIAMELVRGTPLDRLLEAQGPIPLERFTPLLERLCVVIHTAHEQGIVHRDLKPGNVMVLSRAGRLLPKLLDLGIAKHVTSAEPRAMPGLATAATDEMPTDPRLTEDGAVMGSPLYMAPEQWVDAASADARTDQYALAVLCYEALTGHPPFTGATRMAIARAHARQPPPPLGTGMPLALDLVLARALAKRAADRFPSVLELAAAFRAASGVATDPVRLPRLPEAVRVAAEAGAPQPLAQAVAALDAARNAHQARDAIWQVVRVAVRLCGVTALASHAHVGLGGADDADAADALRRLGRRGLTDDEWLELAQALCRPFAALRDAHPVPELVALVTGEAPALRGLLALRAGAAELGGSDVAVRELLEQALPLVAALLDEVAFFADYPLIVTGDGIGEVWMGVRRSERPTLRLRGRALPAGEPALVDAHGVSVLALAPFVQLLPPTPGAPPALFFVEGKGRRGARMVALPDAFEHEDDALWEAVAAGVGDGTTPSGPITGEETCPFPGLAAFGRDDADRFIGREREVDAFVNRLRVEPLLAVVGASGAGKSSFVQAGVIPALPDGWEAITVRPGPAPLAALAARLGLADVRNPDEVGAALRARGAPVVLVVDQLEELFTLVDDPDLRARYAAALAGAARSADDPVRVVLTLRDDFLLHAAALPALRARLGHALQLLTTPAAPELRRILVEPLARAGYELEDPALADEMVAALADTPGALALLSFTASKLWELRDRRFRQLGRKAYASLGGVGGALAQHAEATLRAMPAEEQRLVREVFRHAVTAAGTRAVLSRAELDQVLGGGPHAAEVIEKLVAARLLVASESEAGAERIEVTHEALLDAWPRLVGWRREDAEGAKLRDQLRAASRQWDERGRPSGLLWRGDALTEYRLWRARTDGALTASEEAFTAASLADAARSRRWRVGLLTGAFAILVAGVVALVILNARAETNRQQLHDTVLRQYEDEGRRMILNGEPRQGLAYLEAAADLGASGAAHDFLIAEALEATDGALLQLRIGAPLRSPRFSMDGERIVTGGFGHNATIWDARSGAVLQTLVHGDVVTRAVFSPDDAHVLTASFDHTAAVWDARTGARLHVLPHESAIWCAAYSPDGSRILTAGDDAHAKVWDSGSGALLLDLRGQAATFRVCAWSPDGVRVATGDDAGTLRIWNATTGASVASWHDHLGAIRSLAFAPDGTRLVTSGVDSIALVHAVDVQAPVLRLPHDAAIPAATFSPDGKLIVTASTDRTAALWDASTGARLGTLSGHAAGLYRAVFSPDGTRVVTVSDDGTVRLWDVASRQSLARWIGHRDRVLDASFAPAGDRLVTASDDGTAIVWRAEPQNAMQVLHGPDGAVDDAAFSPDGTHLVSAGHDGRATVWDLATSRSVLTLVGHRALVTWTRYRPDGTEIATASEDGTVRIWDAHTGEPRRVLTGHSGTISQVAWSPDGARLVTAGDDGTVRVWDAATGAQIFAIKAHGGLRVSAAAFSPSGLRIASTGDDNATRLWDAATGALAATYPDPAGPASLAFAPSGTRAVSALSNQTFKVWDVATGDHLLDLAGHVGQTNLASWSPDGVFIVSSALDGTARVWDSASGALLATYGHGRQVWSATFSPDGGRIASTAEDGTIIVRALPRFRGGTAELQILLRCRVPFTIQNGQLISVAVDAKDCPLRTGTAR